MGTWVRFMGVVGVLALVGCPQDTPPPAPPRPAPPRPTPPRSTPPRSTPTPSAESPTPAPSEPRVVRDPSPVAGSPPSSGPEERIRRGAVRRCGGSVSVGVKGVIESVGPRGRQRLAYLSVASGQRSFEALLDVGERLRAGEAELELLAIEDDGDLRVRWLSDYRDPLAEASLIEPAPSDLRLPEKGLYELPDGVAIGVGNVRTVAPLGEEPRDVVTLRVFPAKYELDPLQPWDVHASASAGQVLEGEVRRLTVQEIGHPAEGRGWVVIGP